MDENKTTFSRFLWGLWSDEKQVHSRRNVAVCVQGTKLNHSESVESAHTHSADRADCWRWMKHDGVLFFVCVFRLWIVIDWCCRKWRKLPKLNTHQGKVEEFTHKHTHTHTNVHQSVYWCSLVFPPLDHVSHLEQYINAMEKLSVNCHSNGEAEVGSAFYRFADFSKELISPMKNLVMVSVLLLCHFPIGTICFYRWLFLFLSTLYLYIK